MKAALKATMLMVLACLVLGACGKKGDLMPPPQRESAPSQQNTPAQPQ